MWQAMFCLSNRRDFAKKLSLLYFLFSLVVALKPTLSLFLRHLCKEIKVASSFDGKLNSSVKGRC